MNKYAKNVEPAGAATASGDPASIRNDPAVIDAYLGREDDQ